MRSIFYVRKKGNVDTAKIDKISMNKNYLDYYHYSRINYSHTIYQVFNSTCSCIIQQSFWHNSTEITSAYYTF